MRTIIDVHQHAIDDIRSLKDTDKRAAAAVLVAIEQLKADDSIIDKLTTIGSNNVGSVRLGVKRWESMRRRANLWRFRIFETPATTYRVIYGYQWTSRQLCILAVVHKEDFDYDDVDSEIARRIAEDWRSL